MFRALLLSLALHLMLLSSPGPRWPGAGASHGVGNARLVLRAASVSQPETGPIAGKGRGDKKLSGGDRRKTISPSRGTAPSVFPSFLPSTVAFSAADKSADQNAPTADALAASLPSSEGEREYRLSVARAARKFSSYPSAARERAWEGIVLIAISMSSNAHWPEISLQRSSGYDEIDRQALGMMEQAVKIAAIPSALQGRRFQLVVPVEYRLAD